MNNEKRGTKIAGKIFSVIEMYLYETVFVIRLLWKHS